MRQDLIMPAAGGGSLLRLAGRTILQIIPELDAGGAERTAIDIAAALVAVGATGPNVSVVPLNVVPGVLATAAVMAAATFVL